MISWTVIIQIYVVDEFFKNMLVFLTVLDPNIWYIGI